MIIPAWARYLAAVSLVAGSLYAAYRHGVTTERARAALAVEAERSEAALLVIAEKNRSADQAATLDAKYTGELNDARKQIEDLERGAADAKPVRVFVKAACPSVPATGSPARVGDRSQQGAQLDGIARSDYFDLIRNIALKEKALALCVEASTSK